ncbi:MAG: hypothetical protein KTR32_07105 [Granulosicoccus sp.]|nr:hypothetical protein [Granulosicoccus sp.]
MKQNSKARYLNTSIVGGFTCSLLSAVFSSSIATAETEIRGNVSAQLQGFTATAIHEADHDVNGSIAAEAEIYTPFGDGNRFITITPFLRVDQHDDERTHVDLREFLYTQAADDWEFKVGLGQIFWGVAESRNPVDIINQQDQVESLASSAKLGQPMINATLIKDWGNISAFILPGFRERTLVGEDGRPRLPIIINADDALYESDDEEQHIDFALRYSTILQEWDLGLSYFNGTRREPLLISNDNGATLQPFYIQMEQIGIDLQATLESWLLKAELVHQSGDLIEDHVESVVGFEYSFYGVAESAVDIGIVAEHLWDQRDDSPPLLQNDLLLGLRFALNDEQSSEALIGILGDLDGGGQQLSLEASRRIGNSLKISADAAVWMGTEEADPLHALRNEDYVQIEIAYFF